MLCWILYVFGCVYSQVLPARWRAAVPSGLDVGLRWMATGIKASRALTSRASMSYGRQGASEVTIFIILAFVHYTPTEVNDGKWCLAVLFFLLMPSFRFLQDIEELQVPGRQSRRSEAKPRQVRISISAIAIMNRARKEQWKTGASGWLSKNWTYDQWRMLDKEGHTLET